MAAQKKSILYCSKSKNSITMRLFDAIRSCEDMSTIQALLQEGVDIDAEDLKGRTPLLVACMHRRKQIVDLLIKTGANVDCKYKGNQKTVLHYASQYGWTELVQSLVDKFVDIDVKDIRGETPMHLASKSARLKVVQCLVQEGADFDLINCEGFTPLLYAARYSNKKTFDLLINSRANVVGTERGLLYYSIRNGWTKTVQFLVKRVPNLFKKYLMGEIALSVASSRGHLEVVKLLLEEGTDINREMIGQAALHYASCEGHLEVVKWLVTKGGNIKRVPDLNARDKRGETNLHIASAFGHAEVVKCLVEAGADLNMTAYNKQTALHKASKNGHLEVVNCLVEKGADSNVSNLQGCTPLLLAALSKYKDVVDLLISSGANVDALKWDKQTLLHITAANGWIDTLELLVKRVCDVDAKTCTGFTALSQACYLQHSDIVQALLQAGARWDNEDIEGNSPLNCITMNKKPKSKLIKLLIENGAYLKPVDYNSLVKSSSLEVLQDAKICSQVILNRFNNHDLPELYKLPASRSLPHIEKMKIPSDSEVAQAIERTVGFEILTNGHCNILEVSPMALSVFSVRSVLEYYKKEISELKNGLKRLASFDSVHNCQYSRKLLRLD